jgi:hypothetical protein
VNYPHIGGILSAILNENGKYTIAKQFASQVTGTVETCDIFPFRKSKIFSDCNDCYCKCSNTYFSIRVTIRPTLTKTAFRGEDILETSYIGVARASAEADSRIPPGIITYKGLNNTLFKLCLLF